MGQPNSKKKSPRSSPSASPSASPRGSSSTGQAQEAAAALLSQSSSTHRAPHQDVRHQKRTEEEERIAKVELDATFKQMAEEYDVQMPALSRVKREKFVELKALKDLYEFQVVDQSQYERTRDHILSTSGHAPAPEASPFAPTIDSEVSAPHDSSFAAFFNYAPKRYRLTVENSKALGQDGVAEDWWNDEVRLLPALDQCAIFVSRLCAALDLPWRTVVAGMVLLHRYGHVLALWASKPGAEEYLLDLSLPNRVIVSSACVLLASKVEETLFSMRRLLLAIKQSLAGQFNNLLLAISQHGDPGKVVAERLATSIKQHEIDMLMRLGFDITVEHPHHFVPLYVRLMRLSDEDRSIISEDGLIMTAFMVLDCCIPTSVWLFHTAHFIAIAALYAAWTISTAHAQERDASSANALPPFDWSVFHMSSAKNKAYIKDILRFILKGSTSSGVSSHYAELKKAITTADFFTPLGDNKAITVPHAYQPSACRDVANLVVEEVLDEGTYGCVSVAKDPVSGKNFALKLLKNTNGRSGFPYYMLREVLFLQRLNHPNVVHGKEIVVDRNHEDISHSQFSIVMEYVSFDMREVWFQQRDKAITPRWTVGHIKVCATDTGHAALHCQSTRRAPLPEHTADKVQNLMMQLLKGVAYMHQLGIMHRDIKLKNLLLDSDGTLKVADLGSIRETGRTQLKLTTAVVTLWYRYGAAHIALPHGSATFTLEHPHCNMPFSWCNQVRRPPELLLGAKEYTSSIDMWSIGCVFVELLCLKPPFPGYSVREMMSWIVSVLGRPEQETWMKYYAHLPEVAAVEQADRQKDARPLRTMLTSVNVSESGISLIESMLNWDPAKRITAFEALSHPYWFTEDPQPEVYKVNKFT